MPAGLPPVDLVEPRRDEPRGGGRTCCCSGVTPSLRAHRIPQGFRGLGQLVSRTGSPRVHGSIPGPGITARSNIRGPVGCEVGGASLSAGAGPSGPRAAFHERPPSRTVRRDAARRGGLPRRAEAARDRRVDQAACYPKSEASACGAASSPRPERPNGAVSPRTRRPCQREPGRPARGRCRIAPAPGPRRGGPQGCQRCRSPSR
jgi:hypothetical protein